MDRDLGKKGNSCRARWCRAGLLHVTPGNSENRNRRPRLETEKPRLKWWLLGPMLLPQQDLGLVRGCESWDPTEGSIRLCWQGRYLEVRSKTEISAEEPCGPSSFLTLLFVLALGF